MKEKVARTLSHIILPQKPAVLSKFDALGAGESMVVANEHNPILLYYQLLADRGNTFQWEYLERGNPAWRVKITKQAPATPTQTIGELAAKDFRMAEVFQLLGIPYCCEGKKTLEETCREAGIKPQTLEKYYHDTEIAMPEEAYAFDKWKAGFLADYILRTHHANARQYMSKLYEQALEVAAHKGPQYPVFAQLAERLKHFFAYLTDHLQKEEQELYPLIKTLEAGKKRKRRLVVPINPPVRSRVKNMEQEHVLAGAELRQFKELTSAYALPAQSCERCQALYTGLKEFENDLIQHIHLENNVLFPKVMALEQEVVNRRA